MLCSKRATGLPSASCLSQFHSVMAIDGGVSKKRKANREFSEAGMEDALRTLETQRQRGSPITSDSVYHVLQAAATQKNLPAARRLYQLVVSTNLASSNFLADNFIRLFGSCGCLEAATDIFCRVSKPSVLTWNSIISVHVRNGQGRRALELFDDMKIARAKPDKVTYLLALKACGMSGSVDFGRLLHEEIVDCGLIFDETIGNALLDMYAKCQSLEEACKVFDHMANQNVVSWTAMISGYASNGHGFLALKLFENMLQEGIVPNAFTFSSVFQACGGICDMKHGSLAHDIFIRNQLKSNVITAGALVDMYAKCGCLKEARKMFDGMPQPDIVSWGALISGYIIQGDWFGALEIFEEMEQKGVLSNRATLLSVVKACSMVGATEQGKLVHDRIMRCGLESDVAIGSTLLDMYRNCGSLKDASNVFERLPDRDAVTWGAMIAGYASLGSCELAWRYVEDMLRHGFKPRETTFTNILNSCGQAGLSKVGHDILKMMREAYGIVLNLEHFGCLVDSLSRAGQLSEAEAILQTMPISPDIILWRSLLTCCKRYGNRELGERCFHEAVELDPDDASGYVLMLNMHVDSHEWEDSNRVLKLQKSAGANKMPGKAWVEVRDKVHQFIVANEGNRLACCSTNTKLCRMGRSMKKDEGYVPQADLVTTIYRVEK